MSTPNENPRPPEHLEISKTGNLLPESIDFDSPPEELDDEIDEHGESLTDAAVHDPRNDTEPPVTGAKMPM